MKGNVLVPMMLQAKIAQCVQFFSENDKHLIINGIVSENCAVFAHLLP
jgi:hypothetical protein